MQGGHNNSKKLDLTQINCNTVTHNIPTHKLNLTNKQLLGLFICVCTALYTTAAHNTAQNRRDNFPSYHPDNHHCSDGGGNGHLENGSYNGGCMVCTENSRLEQWHGLRQCGHVITKE